MREPIKILDGPLEGEIYQLDRRMFQLYDEINVNIKNNPTYRYAIVQTGLKFIR